MHIKNIRVYKVDLPVARGGYRMSGNRIYKSIEDTVVLVDTDTGITGIGESCPQGSDYLAAFAGGVRAGVGELAQYLIGQDPRQLTRINQIMDQWLPGHLYVKTAIDMACWDILGKSVGLPIYELMGGRVVDDLRIRVGVKTAAADEMAAILKTYLSNGFFHFSAKVGDDPDDDIERLQALTAALQPGQTVVADANRGWLPHQALRVMGALRSANNIYFEQPCFSYAECLTVRRSTNQPIILDECIEDVHGLVRAYSDGAADGINLKTSRIGGLTKMRQMRDLCVSLGLAVYIQDAWGSAIAAAAIAHLAHSTPQKSLLGVWDPIGWNTVQTAHHAPAVKNGVMRANDRPGLGIDPNMDVLGSCVAEYK